MTEGTAGLEGATTIAKGVTEVPISHPDDSILSNTLSIEDDDYGNRSQRRRYEEPRHLKIRKQLLGIAESVGLPERSIGIHSLDYCSLSKDQRRRLIASRELS